MASRTNRRGGGGFAGTGQDFELNLAPIIDCFTFIIVFLLTSASFVNVGVIDVNALTGSEESATASTPPPDAPEVTLKLREPASITLEIKPVKGPIETIEYPASNEGLQLGAMSDRLKKLKETSPALSGATIYSADGIRYKDLVHTVESVRQVLPGVSVGSQRLGEK